MLLRAEPAATPADAGTVPRRAAMRLSFIVPAYNNGAYLTECLRALRRSSVPDAEIIVVDDASTDDSVCAAVSGDIQLIRLPRNSGPGAARNAGARAARGEILFFVDADVVLPPDAAARVLETFDRDPELTAMFGSYDANPRAPGVVSQYRNLLHHFVHQHGSPQASTFWAGCGAVRRAAFEVIGGFDERRYPRPSIEDIELGYRLCAAGHRIFLDRNLQATHLKQWKLASVIVTDVTCRAIPWGRLILERKTAPRDLNLTVRQRLSVGAVGLASVAAALAPAMVEALGAVAVLLLGVVALNRDLFAFFGRQRGCLFAVRCIPLHLLYYLYSGVSYVYVCVEAKLPARMSTSAASSSSESAAEPYRHPDGMAPDGGPSRHAPRGHLARLWARWTVIAHIIGNFQARVVLTLFYFLVVPPFAIVLKALKDPLTLKTPSAPQPPGGSFWTERAAEPQLSERGHRQF